MIRRRTGVIPSAALTLAAALGAAVPSPAAADAAQLQRGGLLYGAAGCANCHTDRDGGGLPAAGGRALVTPFGTFYAPNITPDPVHGIGRFSDEDFVRALREGRGPDGRHYYPAFPYPSYTRMTRADMLAIKAWLFARVAPAATPNRDHDLPRYARWRALLGIWKWMYFSPGEFRPAPGRGAAWNRGAYLVQAVSHCGECHTPRNFLGAPDRSRVHAGSRDGAEGKSAPNITPDRRTGIGRWRADDVAYYLKSGATPGGDYAGGLMAEMIDNGLRDLDESDRRAIGAYVLALPPIDNEIARDKTQAKKKKGEFD